jgi:hypothetical protein
VLEPITLGAVSDPRLTLQFKLQCAMTEDGVGQNMASVLIDDVYLYGFQAACGGQQR